MRLDPSRTFRSLVVGPSNNYAVLLARRTIGRSTQRPNPLVIWGDTGVGKTHLLHAMAAELIRRRPGTRVLAFTAEQFMNRFVAAIRAGTVNDLRSDIEHCDALIVDGLEFLENRPATMGELACRIGALVERGAPVLLATGSRTKDAIERALGKYANTVIAELWPPTVLERLIALRRTLRRRTIANARLFAIACRHESIPEARAALENALFRASRAACEFGSDTADCVPSVDDSISR